MGFMKALMAAALVLALGTASAEARDLYLTSATLYNRFYLDVQSVQTIEKDGATVRLFTAEGYRLNQSKTIPAVLRWSLAANCSAPYRVARVEETLFDEQGRVERSVPFHVPNEPYLFEQYQPLDLFGDFWLAACRGEGMQLTEHRMFARPAPEVLKRLRESLPPGA